MKTLKKTFPLLLQPRPGKKLLVLDLDFTLWDGRSQVELSEKLRPGLFDFLYKVLEYYDIIIWSNNPLKFLMIKLQTLGLLDKDLRVIAVLDRSFIFQIDKEVDDQIKKVSVKALEIIWNQLECFNTHNTVHVDDSEGNFSLNPRQGLKIKPFKVKNHGDCELKILGEYLVQLAKSSDFNDYSHKNWNNTKASMLGSNTQKK